MTKYRSAVTLLALHCVLLLPSVLALVLPSRSKKSATNVGTTSGFDARNKKSSLMTQRNYRNRVQDEEKFTTSAVSSPSHTGVADPPFPYNEQKRGYALGGINIGMMRNIGLSQVALVTAAVIFTEVILPDHFHAADWVGSIKEVWPTRDVVSQLLAGSFAATPIILASRELELSSYRQASYVNFATTNVVISLFGRRRQLKAPETNQTSTSMVFLFSMALTLLTATAEESVFRLLLPTVALHFTGSIALAVVTQALLFGLGHVGPHSRPGENVLVASIQTMHGLWYGFLYMVTGSLIPSIIAHFLFDMHSMVGTWHQVNNQIDWTETSFPQPMSELEQAELDLIQKESGQALTSETLAFCKRFFYAFDQEHKGSLSLPDVQRAVTYAFLNDSYVPKPHEVGRIYKSIISDHHFSNPDRMNLPQFVRLLFSLRSQMYKQQKQIKKIKV